MGFDTPTSTSDLLFPLCAQNFSTTLSALKRSTLSTSNRLSSIYQDSKFVERLNECHKLPVVANERCGSWYIRPERIAARSYFKSTDGHYGQWAFSTRRLNLHLLHIIGKAGGCIVVDSTRRGKSMPDALSKTIPIWCCVINRLLFESEAQAYELRTPKEVISESEHAQIEARMDGFLRDVKSLELDISGLRHCLKKPLRLAWVTPDVSCGISSSAESATNDIICCTASRRVYGAEASGDGYIQGAGDDSEGWAHNLTPAIFWTHREELLSTAPHHLPDLILRYTTATGQSLAALSHGIRIGTTCIYIGYTGAVSADCQTTSFDGIINCCQTSRNEASYTNANGTAGAFMTPKLLQLQCGSGKLASRALRTQLPLVPPFIESIAHLKTTPRLLITCSTGKDISVGVALTILCKFFDSHYQFRPSPQKEVIDKTSIRRRLAVITASKPDISPSRATLQSVHSFLMPMNGQAPDDSRSLSVGNH
ncbi:MAG: hypothetical protein Q9163_001304 [Psora crenata]